MERRGEQDWIYQCQIKGEQNLLSLNGYREL